MCINGKSHRSNDDILTESLAIPQRGIFAENGYMQSTSMYVLFVNDKDF